MDVVDEAPIAVPKRPTRKSTRRTTVEEEQPRRNDTGERAAARGSSTPMEVEETTPVQLPQRKKKFSSDHEGHEGHESLGEKITLPISDTPIINRNKEMRKKGAGGRRSSLGGMRGRRASSLIEMGHTALPHKEVQPEEFYKSIEAGLPEPRRMKQLLTWCGERALSKKPPHGSADSNAIHGGMLSFPRFGHL